MQARQEPDSTREIEILGRGFGERFGAGKVILFGSYARGEQHTDPDVDLLVIMPTEGQTVYQAAKIRASLRTDLPVDIIVRTPDQVRQRLELGDSFVQEIFAQGKILYESPNC